MHAYLHVRIDIVADNVPDNESAFTLPMSLASRFPPFFLQSYMEDAAQHVGADMAQRILTGGPDLAQLEKGPKALPTPCACSAAAPAGDHEHQHHHHNLRAVTPGPDKGAGDSDVESPSPRGVDAERSQDAGIAVV